MLQTTSCFSCPCKRRDVATPSIKAMTPTMALTPPRLKPVTKAAGLSPMQVIHSPCPYQQLIQCFNNFKCSMLWPISIPVAENWRREHNSHRNSSYSFHETYWAVLIARGLLISCIVSSNQIKTEKLFIVSSSSTGWKSWTNLAVSLINRCSHHTADIAGR